ncbi:MAG: DUF2891 family protein [Nitrospirales bacterium]|nr:DUF2891 family protein [Nitrospirales bacterium]
MDNGIPLHPSTNCWDTFCASRADYLTALAQTVAAGVRRQDTDHPAFCGCIDWHSCVHGLYALLTVSRLTCNPQWATIAEALFQVDRLEEEFASIQTGKIDQELPYGYSWFLKLAQERERYSGKRDLLPLATECTTRLTRWVFSLSGQERVQHTKHCAYNNLSWALLNLWEWAQFKNDTTLTENIFTLIKNHLLPFNEETGSSSHEMTNEFFSSSLQRIRLILRVFPQEQTFDWLKAYMRKEGWPKPITHLTTAHSAGLNFSRSWALWDLFRCLGRDEIRDSYARHIITHMTMPQYWRENYKHYSHWVPQFGVYAIALSMEEEKPEA